MNKYLSAAVDGSLQGIRETPSLFFAPVVALFGFMFRVTENARLQHERKLVVRDMRRKHDVRLAGRR